MPPTGPPGVEAVPGETLWRQQRRLAGEERAVALASDAAGRLLLLAQAIPAERVDLPQGQRSTALTLSQYDADGQPRWEHTLQPEAAAGGRGEVVGRALAVSPQGDVFVAGLVVGRARLGDVVLEEGGFLAQWGPEGALRWVQRSEALALAALPQGEVVAAGLSSVLRLDAQGQPVWAWQAPFEVGLTALAADASGQVVVAGQRPVGSLGAHGLVLGLTPQGQLAWQRELEESVTFTDAAFTPQGTVLLAGDFNGRLRWGEGELQSRCFPQGCYLSVVVLAAGADGTPLWGQVLDAQALSVVEEARLAPDAQGGAAVVWQRGCGSTLVRLDAGGGEVWRRRFYREESPCTGASTLSDVAMPAGEGLVVAGSFEGSSDFGGGEPVVAEGEDVFLLRVVP